MSLYNGPFLYIKTTLSFGVQNITAGSNPPSTPTLAPTTEPPTRPSPPPPPPGPGARRCQPTGAVWCCSPVHSPTLLAAHVPPSAAPPTQLVVFCLCLSPVSDLCPSSSHPRILLQAELSVGTRRGHAWHDDLFLLRLHKSI